MTDQNADHVLPTWYEVEDGGIYCQWCRQKMLTEWSPGRVKNGIAISEDETCRPRDFHSLGKRPWAGSPPGDRYYQCDECLGQWGPDA